MSEIVATTVFDILNLYSLVSVYPSEYCVDSDKFTTIMTEIKELIDNTTLKPNVSLVEVRYSKADHSSQLDPSSNFPKKVVWIGFRLASYTKRTEKTFIEMEKIILRHGGISHWAKDGYNLKWYNRIPTRSKVIEFYDIKKKMDPDNKFTNQVLEQMNY
jgi:hypothetical protein